MTDVPTETKQAEDLAPGDVIHLNDRAYEVTACPLRDSTYSFWCHVQLRDTATNAPNVVQLLVFTPIKVER